MKRNLIAVIALSGFAMLCFVAVAVLGFCYDVLVAGVAGAVCALFALWFLIGSVWREICYERYEHYFHARDFFRAKKVLDGAQKNWFLYPLFRTVACQLYMQVCTAMGDTASAEHYISLLRHGGGAGWKYKTAFYFILLNLAWEDVSAAREEFEDFAANCGHAVIYKEQIEVLSALFARIDGEREDLPESVKNSPYPVVHKVIERCEDGNG